MGASVSSTDLARSCSNRTVAAPSVYAALVRFQEIYGPVHGYVSATLCIFGVVANLANLAVLTRRSMAANSINSLLIAVAAADLMTMLTYFFQVVHFTGLNPRATRDEMAQPHTVEYAWILYSLFAISLVLVVHTAACWLTVALAVFRYLYIALPASGARLASARNVRISIAAVYLVCCIASIPNYLVNAPRACHSSVSNRTVYFIDAHEAVSEVLQRSNYWTIAILYKILPCLMLSVMTILLIGQLSKSARRRRTLFNNSAARKREQRADAREQRTTRMLLAIVLLFLITELPQGVMSLLCFVADSFADNVYTPMGDLLDLLSLINNSVNFLLYSAMSRQFRDTFSAVFLAWLPRRAAASSAEAAAADAAGGGGRLGGQNEEEDGDEPEAANESKC